MGIAADPLDCVPGVVHSNGEWMLGSESVRGCNNSGFETLHEGPGQNTQSRGTAHDKASCEEQNDEWPTRTIVVLRRLEDFHRNRRPIPHRHVHSLLLNIRIGLVTLIHHVHHIAQCCDSLLAI